MCGRDGRTTKTIAELFVVQESRLRSVNYLFGGCETCTVQGNWVAHMWDARGILRKSLTDSGDGLCPIDRKGDDVRDVAGAGCEHEQSIDAEGDAGALGKPVLERG